MELIQKQRFDEAEKDMDFFRQRNKVIQPQPLFMIHGRVQPVERVIGTVAHQEGVVSGLFQLLGHGNGLFHIPAILLINFSRNGRLPFSPHVVLRAQTAGNWAVLGGLLLDALDDLRQDSQLTVHAAAKLICPVIENIRGELVTHIAAVSAVDVDAVGACLIDQLSPLYHCVDEPVNLLRSHGPAGDLWLPAVGTFADSYRLILHELRKGHTAQAEPDLHKQLRIVLVQSLGELTYLGDKALRRLERRDRKGTALQMGIRHIAAGEHSAHAALGSLYIVVDHLIRDDRVLLKPTDGQHGRHDHLVLDLHLADLERLEQFRVSAFHGNDLPNSVSLSLNLF